MNLMVAPSPFLNLANVIRTLRGSVGGWVRPGWLSIPLVLLLFRRLGEIDRRMAGLAARFQAGRLWRRGARLAAPKGGPAMEGARAGEPRERTARLWPGQFGWLVRRAGYHAAAYGSQLRAVLVQPEMVALLEASPQAARVLRPLCRALGVETALLRPGAPDAERPAKGATEPVATEPVSTKQRVRKKRPAVDWGRIPLPRGVLTWARRQGFGKVPRG